MLCNRTCTGQCSCERTVKIVNIEDIRVLVLTKFDRRLLQMVDIVQAKGQKSKSVRQEKSVVMTYDKFMNDTEEASVLLTLYSLVLII